LIRSADKDKYPTAASLKTARIAAQRGTIQVDVATQYILGQKPPTPLQAPTPVEANAQAEANALIAASTLMEASTIRNLVQDLKNGKVDAIVLEQPVAQAYLAKNPDLFLSPVSFKDDEGGTAIAVKKGNTDLLLSVEKTIARLIAAKKIDQFVVEANELVEN
jgi:polar amino acid transport system substrate-binding protein